MPSSLLSTLLLLLVGVALARVSARHLARWAVPAIVLELLVGFVLGNSVLPYERLQPLTGLTELGVLTLFFQVGLEVQGGLLGARPLAVLRTVLLSALTPLLAWWPLQQAFHLSPAATVLVLAALSATGTGVTLRALSQANALHTPSGALLLGVSVLDDLPAIGLLPLGLWQGSATAVPAGGRAIGPLLGLLVMAATLLVARRWRGRFTAWTPTVLQVLLLLIACSWLGECTGLTSLLGALWGGVLLTRLAPRVADRTADHRLTQSLALLSDVFLPLYFMSVGMRVQASTLLQPAAWGMAAVLLLVAIGCKWLCALGVGRADRAAGVDRWVVVFGLLPRGVPGLVVATSALAAGVINSLQFSALVLMVSATTVLGLLLLGRRLVAVGAAADAPTAWCGGVPANPVDISPPRCG